MNKGIDQKEFDYYIPPSSYIDPEFGIVGIRDTTTGVKTRATQFLLQDYSGRAIMSAGGYGMSEVAYIEQKGPFQHGKTLLGYRLQPRKITLEFRENSKSREEYYRKRAELLALFRVNKQPVAGELNLGVLRKILPPDLSFESPDRRRKGAVRDIDVLLESGMQYEFNSGDDWDYNSNVISFELIAPDPTFYDPQANIEEVVLSATTELAFPKTIKGWAVSLSAILIGDLSIPYVGYGTPNLSATRLTDTIDAIAVNEILIIDSEKLVVTNVVITDANTGTLTVTRGYGGTAAAAHNSSSLIAVTKDITTVANFAITATTYEPWRVVYDFSSTLAAAISAVDTTITYAAILATTSAAAVGDVLFCQTVDGGTFVNEKMLVTAVNSSTSVTVTRGHDDTVAVAHGSGDKLVVTTSAQITQNKNALGITFGSATLSEGFVINYEGTWDAFPTISVTGPWDNFTITNGATLETLDFGYNIDSGETVVFDLAYGIKSVTNQNGTNLIGSLSTDSDLATFHLATDSEVTTQLADGINPMTVTGTNLDENSALILEWYTRYIGI